jgi:hypothetical protein
VPPRTGEQSSTRVQGVESLVGQLLLRDATAGLDPRTRQIVETQLAGVLPGRLVRPAAPAADVRVVLVRHALPGNGVVPLGGLWPALVAAAASGTAPATLPDGGSRAAATLWRSPAAPVDTRIRRSVSFDLDLTAVPLFSSFVLVAVVMSASNQISPADLVISPGSNPTTVDQLVTTSPHVAARSVALVV